MEIKLVLLYPFVFKELIWYTVLPYVSPFFYVESTNTHTHTQLFLFITEVTHG